MIDQLMTVYQVAELLHVAPMTIYRHIKKLKLDLVEQDCKKYLAAVAVETLRNTCYNTVITDPASSHGRNVTDVITLLRGELVEKNKLIDNLVSQQTQERQRTDTIVMSLTRELETFRKLFLESPPATAALTSAQDPDPEEASYLVNAAKIDDAPEPEPASDWSITLADFEAAIREAQPVAIPRPAPIEVKKPWPIAPDPPPLSWLDRSFYGVFMPWKLRRQA